MKWNDMKTNEQVLSAVGERKTLIETIVNRKNNWIGHILRGDGDALMEGTYTRTDEEKSRGQS